MTEKRETEERIERYGVRHRRGRLYGWFAARKDAEDLASLCRLTVSENPLHRVVHLVELRPGERIVSEVEVPTRDDGAVWVKVARELLPQWRAWSEPHRVRIVPRPEFDGAAEMELQQVDAVREEAP